MATLICSPGVDLAKTLPDRLADELWMFGLLIFRGQDLVEKDRFSFPVFLGNEDHRDKPGHITYIYMLYIRIQKFLGFQLASPVGSYRFVATKNRIFMENPEDLLRLAELFAEPAKASGQRSPRLWRSIVCVIAIPYHEAIGIFRAPSKAFFTIFHKTSALFFFFYFFFGGQDFWHSDNSYVGFLDPLLATKSYKHLLQHRLPVTTEADEPGGPTLLYALKVPEGPEVLQVKWCNHAKTWNLYFFVHSFFFKQPSTCIPTKGANSTSICISC